MSWVLHLRGRVKKNIQRFPIEYQQEIAGVLRELTDDPYADDIVKLRGEKMRGDDILGPIGCFSK